MKTKILTGLLLVVTASFILVHAEDNPSQAAARAALMKKLLELDHAQAQPSSGWDSGVGVASPPKSTNHLLAAVATNTVTSQVFPAAKPEPMPKHEAPLVAASAKSVSVTPAPTNTQTATVANPTPLPPKIVPAVAAPASSSRLTVAPNSPPASTPVKPNPNLTVTGTNSWTASLLAQPPNDLMTTTGAIYRHVQVERVETNALIISYVPSGGGTAMTRVYFEELSAEVRQQYEKK